MKRIAWSKRVLCMLLIVSLLLNPMMTHAEINTDTYDSEVRTIEELGEEETDIGEYKNENTDEDSSESLETDSLDEENELEIYEEELEERNESLGMSTPTSIPYPQGEPKEFTAEELGLQRWDDGSRKSRVQTFSLQQLNSLPIGTIVNIPITDGGITYVNPCVIVNRNHPGVAQGTILKFNQSWADIYFGSQTGMSQIGFVWNGVSINGVTSAKFDNSYYFQYINDTLLNKLPAQIVENIIPYSQTYVSSIETTSPFGKGRTTISSKLWVPTRYQLYGTGDNSGTGEQKWLNANVEYIKAKGNFANPLLDLVLRWYSDDGYTYNSGYIGTTLNNGNYSNMGANSGSNNSYLNDFIVSVEPYMMLPNNLNISPNQDGSYDILFDSTPSTPVSITVPGSITYGTNFTVSWAASTSESGNLAGYKLERQINGGAWVQVYQGTANSTSQTLTRDQANTVNYRVKAYSTGVLESDYATGTQCTIINNIAPPASGSITVPTTILYNQAFAVSWSQVTDPDEDVVTYILEQSINGGTYNQVYSGTNLNTSLNLTRGAANNVTYRIKTQDSRGLSTVVYTTSANRTVTNNRLPSDPPSYSSQPAATIDSWDNTTITWGWNASTDADSDAIYYAVEVALNGTNVWNQVATGLTTRSYAHTINRTTDNLVQIRVKAYDNYGGSNNYSNYTTSNIISLRHDTDNPELSLVAAPDSSSGWTASNVIITAVMSNALSPLTKIEAPAGVTPTGEITLSGNTATQNFTVTSVGNYQFTVYNKAGQSTTRSISVGNVDQIKPVINYTTSIPDGQFTNGNVDIQFTLSDSLSGLLKFITPNETVDYDGETTKIFTYTATQNGAPTFTLLDRVFNTSNVNVVINMIDRVNPTVLIDSNMKQWNNQASVKLQISAADDYSGVQSIRLPNDSTHNGSSTEYDIFENGTYRVTSTDKAGNISSEDFIQYNWFDRTKPSIVSLSFEETTQGLVSRAFSNIFTDKDLVTNKQIKMVISYDDTPTGTEAESGVEYIKYRVYDYQGTAQDDWITTIASDTIPNISYEVNGYVEVQVIDRAGNISDIEVYEILLDSTAPTVQMQLSETGITNQPVHVTLTGFDEVDGSGYKGFIVPDGNMLVPLTEIKYTFYENGSRTFIGCDNAGNQTPITVNITNIKLNPPVLEDIEMEKIDGSGTNTNTTFDGFASDKEIKATIVAIDVAPVDIVYCITSYSVLIGDEVWLDSITGEVIIDSEMIGYMHAKALDIAGNWSNIYTKKFIFDETNPSIGNIEISNTNENLLDLLELSLGNYENVNDGVILDITDYDNLGFSERVYCITDSEIIPTNAEWHPIQSNQITLQPSLNGYIHIKGVDLAGNESTTVVKRIILDGEDPTIESIQFEETGNILQRLSIALGLTSNKEIKANIIAQDNISVAKIIYCITADETISSETNWFEATNGSIVFDSRMNGILHVVAIDTARNESTIASRFIILDDTNPIIDITYAERENDFEPVIVQVWAEDDSSVDGISGINKITLPNGDIIYESYTEYMIKENGTYLFKATDNAKNEVEVSVSVDYIRPVVKEDWENNIPVIDAILHATGKRNISEVNYTDVTSIVYLDLSAKGLKSIPDILGYGKNIKHLDLRGNELLEIPESVFRMKNLERLDVSNNELRYVNEKITNLNKLKYLDISLNYLVDYEIPLIISDYRNIGNFTYNNQPDQYSFEFTSHVYQKEYVGNTIQVNIAWKFNGEQIGTSLEQHRKNIYSRYYSDYKTYRPIEYRYETSVGKLKDCTSDYARVLLDNTGVLSLSIKLGSEISGGNARTRSSEYTSITAKSKALEVIGLPAPTIQSIDVMKGSIIVDASGLDDNIKADLKAVVEVYDSNNEVVAKSEAVVPESKICEVPLALVLKKGHVVTAKLMNNDFIGDTDTQTNQSNGGGGSNNDSGNSGGSSGGGNTIVEYLVIEREVEKEVILEVEKIREIPVIVEVDRGGDTSSSSDTTDKTEENTNNTNEIIGENESISSGVVIESSQSSTESINSQSTEITDTESTSVFDSLSKNFNLALNLVKKWMQDWADEVNSNYNKLALLLSEKPWLLLSFLIPLLLVTWLWLTEKKRYEKDRKIFLGEFDEDVTVKEVNNENVNELEVMYGEDEEIDTEIPIVDDAVIEELETLYEEDNKIDEPQN